MTDQPISLAAGPAAQAKLKVYAPELPFGGFAVGVDNIHHDVYLSPAWTEQTRTYLLELIRQTTGLTYTVEKSRRMSKGPETSAWKRQLLELLQNSLTRAKFEKKIELDILLRVSLIKFLTQEIGAQFATLLLEAKEYIRNRGEYFERSEQAHVMKARLAELQGDRRNIFRQVGRQVYQILSELEENQLARARRSLFGDEQALAYEMLAGPLVFVENGRDDVVFLEQYVLLGNYMSDADRFEIVDGVLIDFVRQHVLGGQGGPMSQAWKRHKDLTASAIETRALLASIEQEREVMSRRLERGGGVLSRVGLGAEPDRLREAIKELDGRMVPLRAKLEKLGPEIDAAKAKAEFLAAEMTSRLGDYLNEPENAHRLLDPDCSVDPGSGSKAGRSQLLDLWMDRLAREGLLPHVLASYELRNIYHDYCPPIHLQQLKKALVSREEFNRVLAILQQFPARGFSMERIETLCKKLKRYPQEETRALALRFAEDFMRMRRDLRNYERLTAAMERVQLVRSERTRDLSRLNNSLYEFLLPSETRPAQDHVVNHAVIKADVRGSTRITKDLLARGLNPATLFSLNFYEPVKRILERYGAAKVFIEGDAMVLAIFETESNRSHQRAVSKGCALARQILAIAAAYNERPDTGDLPRLELGVGVAFQGSAPTYWEDSDSRIMISRALNLSDRLSSCSKIARRMLEGRGSLFRLFVFQPGVEGAAEEDEADEFLIRYNLNGIELNEEGFAKLQEEISLQAVEVECEMPWGREQTTFFSGHALVGETLEPILLRRGFVRQMLADGRIGPPGHRAYYEVCADPRVHEMVEALLLATADKA